MVFKCKRCGRCCQPPTTMRRNTWTGGKLTWEQKQQLLEERKKYLPNDNDKSCEMLYFENGLAACLVWVMFGRKTVDQSCMNYPGNEKCFGKRGD